MRASRPVDVVSQSYDPTDVLLESVDAIAAADPAGRRQTLATGLRDALESFATEHAPVDVVAMARTAADVARGLAAPTTRVVCIPPLDKVESVVDYARTSLALLHLITNAVLAANEAREGVVVVSVCKSIAGGAYIEVSDNGPGMDRRTLEQAWKPFWTTRPDENAGLGLPLARAMLRSCGGDVGLLSAPGAGTVAVVDLPACDDRYVTLPA